MLVALFRDILFYCSVLFAMVHDIDAICYAEATALQS